MTVYSRHYRQHFEDDQQYPPGYGPQRQACTIHTWP